MNPYLIIECAAASKLSIETGSRQQVKDWSTKVYNIAFIYTTSPRPDIDRDEAFHQYYRTVSVISVNYNWASTLQRFVVRLAESGAIV